MWPKALLELLPHLTRLVPLLNRYFQSKGSADDATRLALERKLDDVSLALHKNIADASAALPVADLNRQLSKQGSALTELAASLRTIESQLERFDTRLTSLEKRSGSLASTVVITHVLTLVVCILLVIALVYQLHK